MRSRWVKARGWAWKLALPAVGVAVAGQLALAGSAAAAHNAASTGHTIQPKAVNMLDCNGWSRAYKSANPAMRRLCTDPRGAGYGAWAQRFYDNGHYVGHDEPSVKFISSLKGSGNTMTYAMRLPKDPKKSPTASASVTDYAELSVAPWFGLPICDGKSYPQNPCTPDSDTNLGSISNPRDAGSAFMELQFYPPGNTPFTDFGSCSKTQYCAALNIDSLSCTFNFATCNNNCIEPVNFSYLQTNGVPPGPAAPQDPNAFTWLGNAKTLRMNPGDTVAVSITDPAGGLTATVRDLTTHQTGYMQASAKNGFADTNGVTKSGTLGNCSGTPFTFHAEYNTAKVANQVPWAALEGGVLMEQEVGHFESCSSVASKEGYTASYTGGTSYKDPNVYQTCTGGLEGKGKRGEGPCSAITGKCRRAETQGRRGPVACPNRNAGQSLCEYSDGFCANKGTRTVTIDGKKATESMRVTGCYQDQYQNGDLDFDGNTYIKDWPNGSSNFPQTFRYLGPFTNGRAYAHVQYETDAPGSERLCHVATGVNCTAPPVGAKFYPYWSMSNKEPIAHVARSGVCVWNFGNYSVKGVTKSNFGKDKQYGTPDTARYAGTTISKVMSNPTLGSGCRRI